MIWYYLYLKFYPGGCIYEVGSIVGYVACETVVYQNEKNSQNQKNYVEGVSWWRQSYKHQVERGYHVIW